LFAASLIGMRLGAHCARPLARVQSSDHRSLLPPLTLSTTQQPPAKAGGLDVTD
jgi:hypothetical protein